MRTWSRGAYEVGIGDPGRQVNGQSVLLLPAGVACELLGGALPREVHPALQSKQAALRRVQPVSFAVNKMAAGSRGVMIQKSEFDAAAEDSVLSQIKRASVMRDAEPYQIWPFSSAGGLAPPRSRCGLSTHGAHHRRQWAMGAASSTVPPSAAIAWPERVLQVLHMAGTSKD